MPPSRRSHRGRWVAALAVALILIAGAIGGIFLAAHGSGPRRHPAAAMSMGHAKHKGNAAAKGSAMPMAHKPGTLDKALILANQSGGAAGLLPPSSCRQHNADLVICTNPHPAIDEAQFRTFPTLTALYSAYVTQVKGLSHGRFRANFQNCRQTATQGEVSWNHMYQHPRNYSVAQMESGKITDSQAVGRVFCTFTSGEEFFVWTQNNGHFLGEVVGAPHIDVWNWWVGIHHNIALGGETMKGMHMP